MSTVPTCDPETVQGETEAIDFKARFDSTSRQEWCELVKDLVAMANSGGGSLVFGVNDDGTPSGADIRPVLQLDPADVTNKIHGYTEQQFSGFEIRAGVRHGHPVALISIAGVRIPMIFTAPGTYPTGPAAQKTAFSKGTAYFRHGPKSEPGTTDDLRQALERELGRVKEFWLKGINKVVAAPLGSTIQVIQPDTILQNGGDATPIRLTRDETAPAVRAIQADKLYPYRQTELLKALAERLGPKVVTSHDILCVRRAHGTDDDPTFSNVAKWSPRQYSDTFLEWLVEQYTKDSSFFQRAREAYRHLAGIQK